MKRLFFIALLAMSTGIVMAQTPTDSVHSTIGTLLDSINSYQDADGKAMVVISEDERIELLLNRKNHKTTVTKQKTTPTAKPVVKAEVDDKIPVRGYRIQIFSSNDPKTAKNEALAIRNRARAAFPTTSVYMIYTAPYWKVRMGDYIDRASANAQIGNVRKVFSSRSGEIYLVPDNIKYNVSKTSTHK